MNVGFWLSRDVGGKACINISKVKPVKINEVGLWVIHDQWIVLDEFECLAIFGILPDEGSCDYYAGTIKKVTK